MPLFERLAENDCESVLLVQDRQAGLRAVIALHSTRLGPAFGGIRTMTYDSDEAALDDALRLAAAMTRKAAAAGLKAGGGKAVLLTPKPETREAAFEALGRAVEALGGSFFTGLDVGTERQDLVALARQTSHVAPDLDFGQATARGVLRAIEATVEALDGSPSLAGKRVAVQGLGAVGAALVRMLTSVGAEVVAADVDAAKAAEIANIPGCSLVAPSAILRESCDVLAPCALGGVLRHDAVAALRCRAVAGSANNQLASGGVAERLQGLGILYVPDFIANAGALILGVTEHERGEPAPLSVVDGIGDTVRSLLAESRQSGRIPLQCACRLAEARLTP